MIRSAAQFIADQTKWFVWGTIVLGILTFLLLGYGPSVSPSPHFFAQRGLSRGVVVVVALVLLNYYAHYPKVITGFFKEKDSPYNLALFRLIFFGMFTIGNLLFPKVREIFIYPWVHMPPEKMDVLPLIGTLFHNLPINEPFVLGVTQIWVIAGITSFLGLFTRFSILLFAACTFFLFGIPHHFGMVQHDQHFFLWAVLLALGPAGRVLSLDALIRKWRGKTLESEKGIASALPMRFIWLVLACLYFFPGFWKFWDCGFDFAISDNLINQMLLKWGQLDGWRPFFRIDKYPFLVYVGGLFTVIFEIGFVFIILEKKYRKWLVPAAIMLHVFIELFLKINFFQLFIPYIALWDWHWLKPKNMPVGVKDIWDQRLRPLLIGIGTFFVVMSAYCGATQTHTWPFSCFPLFNVIQTPDYRFLDYKINNNEAFLDKAILNELYPSYKLRAMENRIIYDSHDNGKIEDRQRRIRIITDALVEKMEGQLKIDSVQIHINLKPVDPDLYHQVIENEQITTIHYNQSD